MSFKNVDSKATQDLSAYGYRAQMSRNLHSNSYSVVTEFFMDKFLQQLSGQYFICSILF